MTGIKQEPRQGHGKAEQGERQRMATALTEAWEGVRPIGPHAPKVFEKPFPRDALPTPALVLSLPAFERNLQAMAALVARFGVGLRPHGKMHKCPEVARRQLAAGAIGLCVAKPREAEVMHHAGLGPLLVTSPVLAPGALDRMVALRAAGAELTLVVDSFEGIEALRVRAQAAGVVMPVLVDLDPAMGRTGVAPGPEALARVHAVLAAPALAFQGYQHYAGQVQHIQEEGARRAACEGHHEAAFALLEATRQAGVATPIFTGGGTGSIHYDGPAGLYTDFQCGSYAFMDEEYGVLEGPEGTLLDSFETALTVHATAISQPRSGALTVDAGLKSLWPTPTPAVLDHPAMRFYFAGDEHGIVRFGEACEGLTLGSRVRLRVSHCDPTVNLYDWLWVEDGNARIVEAWPITARGGSW